MSEIETQVNNFIQCLRTMPAFDAGEYAARLMGVEYDYFKILRSYGEEPKYSVEESVKWYNSFNTKAKPEDWGKWGDLLRKLGAGTLGLAFRRWKDTYGFYDSVDEDKARTLSSTALMNLIPYLIEAHINSVLVGKGLKHLHEYTKDDQKDFRAAYQAAIKSNKVQDDLIVSNSLPGLKPYRSSLLYVLEYFLEGGVPYVRGQLASTDPSKYKQSDFASIVENWLKNCQSSTEGTTYENVFTRLIRDPSTIKDKSKFAGEVAQTIIPLDIVYLPELNVGSDVAVYVQNTLEAIRPELKGHLQPLLSAIPNDMLTFCHQMKSEWDYHVGKLSDKVKSSLSSTKTYDKDEYEPSSRQKEFKNDINYGETVKYKYAVQGVDAADAQRMMLGFDLWKTVDMGGHKIIPCQEEWWNDGANRRYSRTKVPRTEPQRKVGCFQAGTKVWTSAGEIPIEDLQEDDRVLTRATTREYGVCSDEQVVRPVEGGHCTLHGFNDGEPFFTGNHVFMTTTGLRALDPYAAKLENPWLDVGTLREGHVLLRTKDGLSYVNEVIEKITSSTVPCTNVYGVHLREGLRSYHANGYLVHLNYPEITVASIAKVLRTFPSDVRMQMLRSIEELRPVFDRFGEGTVDLLLENEILADDAVLNQMSFKPQGDFGPKPLYFQTRSFELIASSAMSKQNYMLPDIDAFDGVLLVQGKECTRARIIERGFQWSRQLQDDLWEHGICTFGNDIQLLSGDGAIWLEAESFPLKPSTEPILFEALAILPRIPEVDDGDMSVGVLSSGGVFHLETQSTKTTTSQDSDDFSNEMSNIQNVSSPKSQEALTSETDLRLGQAMPANVNVQSTPFLTFDVLCEADAWSDTEHSQKPALPLGRLQMTRKSAPGGIVSLSFSIPALDEFSQKLLVRSGVALPELYKVVVAPTESKNVVVNLEILHPEQIALLADNNAEPASQLPKSFENLTFKNLGSDYTMPFLFSTLTFTVNTFEHILQGFLMKFDPDMDGDQGKRHKINGKYVEPAPLSSPGPSTSTGGGGPLPTLIVPKKLNVNALTSKFSVDTNKIKTVTQRLIEKTMRYHMDDDQRSALGFVKPNVSDTFAASDAIPSSLAGLSDEMRKWIRETYANAYIAQNLESIPDDQLKAANIRYTSADIKRLRYFWTGSGKGCLAKSKFYSDLNTEASIASFCVEYPDITRYLTDAAPPLIGTSANSETSKTEYGGMRGGEKWAHLLFDALMATEIPRLAEGSKIVQFTQLNDLEVQSTILNTLLPGNTLSKTLTETVQRYLRDNDIFRYRSTSDGTTMENGIRDYLYALYMLLLDPAAAKAAGIEENFRAEWEKQMAALAEWGEEMKKRSIKDKADALIEMSATGIKELARLTSSLNEPPKESFVSPSKKGLARMWNAVRTTMSANTPKKAKAAGGLCFSLALAGTANYIYESWSQWGEFISHDPKHPFSGIDIAKLVANTVIAFGGVVLTTISALQLWRGTHLREPAPGVNPGAVADAHAANAEREIGRRASQAHPENVAPDPDRYQAQRRNAFRIKTLGGLERNPKTVMEYFVSSKLPQNWKTRVQNYMADKKQEFKDGWTASKARIKQNITVTGFSGLMAAASVVLLVVACIQTAELFKDPNSSSAQKAVAVLGLVFQFIGVILEIVSIFRAVPGWISVGVLVVGLVLSIIAVSLLKAPDPPKTPLQTWWENKGKDFVASKLPSPPKARFAWSATPIKVKSGDDTTIVVKGKQEKVAALSSDLEDLDSRNLSRIEVEFTTKKDDSTTLFDTTDNETFATATGTDLAINQCKITFPDSVSGRIWSSVVPENTITVKRYSATIQLRDRADMVPALAQKDSLPFIDVGEGNEVWFQLRGKIAKRETEPSKEKVVGGENGQIAAWKRYQLLVKETYANKYNEPVFVTEETIDLEKTS